MPGQRPAGPPPPPLPPRRRKGDRPPRRRNLKLILLIAAGVVVALAIALGGILFTTYDRATRIDRGTPTVVVLQYVQALLNDRDPRQVKLFTCHRDQGPGAMQDLRADLARRDADLRQKIEVEIADPKPSISGNTATVAVELRPHVIVNGSFQEDVQNWTFGLNRDSSGWRVCDAHRLS